MYSLYHFTRFGFNHHHDSEHQEELNHLREQIPIIDDYINTAKPEIMTKKLMHILEKSARTDGLTGLFNPKILERMVQHCCSIRNETASLMVF